MTTAQSLEELLSDDYRKTETTLSIDDLNANLMNLVKKGFNLETLKVLQLKEENDYQVNFDEFDDKIPVYAESHKMLQLIFKLFDKASTSSNKFFFRTFIAKKSTWKFKIKHNIGVNNFKTWFFITGTIDDEKKRFKLEFTDDRDNTIILVCEDPKAVAQISANVFNHTNYFFGDVKNQKSYNLFQTEILKFSNANWKIAFTTDTVYLQFALRDFERNIYWFLRTLLTLPERQINCVNNLYAASFTDRTLC